MGLKGNAVLDCAQRAWKIKSDQNGIESDRKTTRAAS